MKTPVHSKNLILMNKTLEKDFKKAIYDKLKKDQSKLWEMIFQKSINDY